MEKKFPSITKRDYSSVDVGDNIFGDRNYVGYIMKVEAALARVQAELGIIPKEAAEEITKKCDINLISAEEFGRQLKVTGNQRMVAIIRVYNDVCDNNYGQYIHYGATTQDMIDTGLVLMMRDAYDLILEKANKLLEITRKLAIENRSLVMMGRTNDQHALPITLGFKFASWVDELRRDIERMEEAKKRIFVGQFHGAVGTLASLGEQGVVIRDNLMKELGLGIPDMAWFSARDRLAEYTFMLACLSGTLGRIGNEVYNASRSEVHEMTQGFKKGNVGSSTMPHKRNPFVSGRLAAFGRQARSVVGDALTMMETANERDFRNLSVEYIPIERISIITDGALDLAINLLSNLEIHKADIQKNVDLLGGLVFSEAFMMRLSKAFGRLEAHEMMYEYAQKAIGEGLVFKDLILADEKIMSVLTPEEIDEIMQPDKYIGLSEYFVDVVTGK